MTKETTTSKRRKNCDVENDEKTTFVASTAFFRRFGSHRIFVELDIRRSLFLFRRHFFHRFRRRCVFVAFGSLRFLPLSTSSFRRFQLKWLFLLFWRLFLFCLPTVCAQGCPAPAPVTCPELLTSAPIFELCPRFSGFCPDISQTCPDFCPDPWGLPRRDLVETCHVLQTGLWEESEQILHLNVIQISVLLEIWLFTLNYLYLYVDVLNFAYGRVGNLFADRALFTLIFNTCWDKVLSLIIFLKNCVFQSIGLCSFLDPSLNLWLCVCFQNDYSGALFHLRQSGGQQMGGLPGPAAGRVHRGVSPDVEQQKASAQSARSRWFLTFWCSDAWLGSPRLGNSMLLFVPILLIQCKL